MVWGIKFHVKQFTETVPNGLNLKISYNYRKDVARGAYTNRWVIRPSNEGSPKFQNHGEGSY